jgi:endonuclease/exonuclease/phosphatase (EEP) superfamily protein YafD
MIAIAALIFSGAAPALSVIEPFIPWSVAALLILSGTSYLGRLHKYLELTSHFRVQYFIGAAVSLPICLALAYWWSAAGALLSAAVNLSVIVPRYIGKRLADDGVPRRCLKVALANVDWKNRSHDPFLRCMERHQPDVIVVQEVNDDWAHSLQALSATYPFFEVLPREDGSGIALYSRCPFERLPFVSPEGDVRPGILVRLDFARRKVSLLSIHPRAPIRRGHFALRNDVLGAAAIYARDLPDPKICVGDLNTSPWSPFYQDFARQTKLINVRKGFGLLPSWPTFMGFSWLMIPIDHCLVSDDIRVVRVQTGERIGSDHLPLLVEMEINEPLQTSAPEGAVERRDFRHR